MQTGAQPNLGQENPVPKLARFQAMSLAISAETILTAVKRGHIQATQAFGKLVMHRDQLEKYRSGTRGVSGEKPTGLPAKTPPIQPLPPQMPVGRPRKGAT